MPVVTSSAPTRSVVQYWELSPSGTVLQTGRLGDTTSSSFYAFPSIAVNKLGDALIGYSRFSATSYASGAYAYRYARGAKNKLVGDTIFVTGKAPYVRRSGTRNRWGDFSATVVDPVDGDCTADEACNADRFERCVDGVCEAPTWPFVAIVSEVPASSEDVTDTTTPGPAIDAVELIGAADRYFATVVEAAVLGTAPENTNANVAAVTGANDAVRSRTGAEDCALNEATGFYSMGASDGFIVLSYRRALVSGDRIE